MAKVNAAGTALDYAGYIGGDADDWGIGIAVDGAGNAYVTGFTSSTEATFPVNGGARPDLQVGGDDAFVAKVNAAGTALRLRRLHRRRRATTGLRHRGGRAGNAYVTGFDPLHRGHLPGDGGA